MLEGHLSVDHDIKELKLLNKIKLLDFIRPGLELVLLQVVIVIEYSERSWELGSLELLSDC